MPPKRDQNYSRKPKHQNTFAYQHNAKSKTTNKILSSPIEGLCKRCKEKIEWRKQYRKYKPRTQPGTCNICKQRNVLAAYHTICTKCATTSTCSDYQPICEMCTKEPALALNNGNNNKEELQQDLSHLKLRERRAIERQQAKAAGYNTSSNDGVESVEEIHNSDNEDEHQEQQATHE